MSITVTNVLLVLEIIARLSAKANRLALKVSQAQREGRDITEEELNEARGDAKSAIDSLGDALKEGD